MRSASPVIPLWVKLAYTAFMIVLVPKYWMDYGPTNFLYFCDVALFVTLIGIWSDDPVWASMAGVGILLPQLLWMVDFLSTCIGVPLVSLTDYMFDSNIPLFTRGLSFFHFWLPLLIVYMIWKQGYDPRGFKRWTVLSICLVLVCYFWMPAPPAPDSNPNLPVNINYVYGFNSSAPQTWMPQPVWLILLLVGLPSLIYFPTHIGLQRVFGIADQPEESASDTAAPQLAES